MWQSVGFEPYEDGVSFLDLSLQVTEDALLAARAVLTTELADTPSDDDSARVGRAR